MKTKTALDRACQYLGSQKSLANRLGVSEQSVSNWKNKVPAERCLDIQRATDSEVTCYELRPDVFPEPEKAA